MASNQQTLLAQALASVANAIFITDKQGHIVWINEAFSRLSGYAPDDLLGNTPAILKSGRQSDGFYHDLWDTILSGKVWQGEVVDRRKDGSLYTAEETVTPLMDDQGDITHFIAIQHDITRRKRESERDHYMAYYDYLTGLPNRRQFLEAQRQAIAHVKGTRGRFATLFLDLDRFKPVNDTLGHQAGDQLLIAVAQRLRAAVRLTDIVARLGGDEFAILLLDIPGPDTACGLARKLISALSQPFSVDAMQVQLSASVGIALYPDDAHDPDVLLASADRAMYRAKFQGGGIFCMASSNGHTEQEYEQK